MFPFIKPNPQLRPHSQRIVGKSLVMSILKMPAKVKKKHVIVNYFRIKASDGMVFKSV